MHRKVKLKFCRNVGSWALIFRDMVHLKREKHTQQSDGTGDEGFFCEMQTDSCLNMTLFSKQFDVAVLLCGSGPFHSLNMVGEYTLAAMVEMKHGVQPRILR